MGATGLQLPPSDPPTSRRNPSGILCRVTKGGTEGFQAWSSTSHKRGAQSLPTGPSLELCILTYYANIGEAGAVRSIASGRCPADTAHPWTALAAWSATASQRNGQRSATGSISTLTFLGRCAPRSATFALTLPAPGPDSQNSTASRGPVLLSRHMATCYRVIRTPNPPEKLPQQ